VTFLSFPAPDHDRNVTEYLSAAANYNLVVRQGDTPVTQEKVEQNVSFVTEEH